MTPTRLPRALSARLERARAPRGTMGAGPSPGVREALREARSGLPPPPAGAIARALAGRRRPLRTPRWRSERHQGIADEVGDEVEEEESEEREVGRPPDPDRRQDHAHRFAPLPAVTSWWTAPGFRGTASGSCGTVSSRSEERRVGKGCRSRASRAH